MNNQFFFLCKGWHNKNYDKVLIMQSWGKKVAFSGA